MCKRYPAAVIALLVVPFLHAEYATASQIFVKGAASATYFIKLIPTWLTLGSYQSSGYTLERGMPDWEGRVRLKVTTSADLMQSRAIFEPKPETIPSFIKDYLLAEPNVPVGAKPFAKLAEDLVHGCKYESEAVEAILSWIGENIAYDEKSRDDDPALVLEKKRGYCVGLANLSLTLLRNAGIPARSDQGLILTPDGSDGGETRMDFQLHRLIEVYYPDVGWVFSDPQKTVNFVSPVYIHWKPIDPGAPQAHINLEGMQIFRSKEDGALLEEDFRPGAGQGRVFIRKNFDLRYAGAIEGRVQFADGRPIGSGMITLMSSAVTSKQPVRPDGRFSFVGLKGGEFTLRFDEGNNHASSDKLKVKDREIRQILLTIGNSANSDF